MNVSKKCISLIFWFTIWMNVFSQQQWKFHVAFESANGERDTLWMVYDTSATFNNVDYLLGEDGVNMDPMRFNVWILNSNFDSTKTEAIPYSSFPYHALNNIHAMNYQYPVIVRWDTSLFHLSYLPFSGLITQALIDNEYFKFINNDPNLQGYNMLIDDSAIAPGFPWGSQEQFPMNIYLRPFTVSVNSVRQLSDFIKLIPDPAGNVLKVVATSEIKAIDIRDSQGRLIISHAAIFTNGNSVIDISKLSTGLYLCFIKSEGRKDIIKFIKSSQ